LQVAGEAAEAEPAAGEEGDTDQRDDAAQADSQRPRSRSII
jgi:hypothetical protein